MTLKDRVFDCKKCGHVQDRDENAAINLECAPKTKYGWLDRNLTPVDKK
jgi:hypothetical protein